MSLERVHPLILAMTKRVKEKNELLFHVLQECGMLIYPRCLLLNLAIGGKRLPLLSKKDLSDFIRTIQEVPENEPRISGLILDLRQTQEDYQNHIVEIIETLNNFGVAVYYVVRSRQSMSRDIPDQHIFPSVSKAIAVMRQRARSSTLKLVFPQRLNYDAFENVLSEKNLHNKLLDTHIVSLNLEPVKEIDFYSKSMFPQLMCSLGQQYGLAFELKLPRPIDLARDLLRRRVLAVTKDYLFKIPDDCGKYVAPNLSWTTQETFGAVPIMENQMTLNREWQKFILVTWEREYQDEIKRLVKGRRAAVPNIILRSYQRLLFQLTENVVVHAGTEGLLCMETGVKFAGTSIFVGDAGIGLLRGMRRSYDMDIRDYKHCIDLAFRLDDYHQSRKGNTVDKTGGWGLSEVRDIVISLKGTIIARSGNVAALFKSKHNKFNITWGHDCFHLRGTQFFVYIPIGGGMK